MEKNISERGQTLLRDPLLNKSTAFSIKERNALKLNGLLPPKVETLEEQVLRCYDAFSMKNTDLERHIYLRALQDQNETLFYKLILTHLTEIMPIIYTPVVGQACEQFHHIYRQPRGLFVSWTHREYIDTMLASVAAKRDIRVIVVTDGERILGLGDQGVGGMGIPIGKLSLYTACGGIDPAKTLPVILDVGTNNETLLNDPKYLGGRHERVRGDDYYQFVDQFVQGIKKHLPNALLQFEDFAQPHAYPLLEKYRDTLCTFNDDIQGTASVTSAAILAAAKIAKKELKDMNIVVFGAGSAGCGISEQLIRVMMHQGSTEEAARAHFFMVDRYGLLHTGMTDVAPFQKKLLQAQDNVERLGMQPTKPIGLLDVIHKAKPDILLGVSGQPNQFTQDVATAMLSYSDRPIIFPLSNPTSRAEGIPSDLLHWTDGKALIATGSPFSPVKINDDEIDIAQCNNSYIFPGMGLAVIASGARRVSDHMMLAAAMALSELAPAVKTGTGRLLPELDSIRKVSRHIAKAVINQAIEEGHANPMDQSEIEKTLDLNMWYPNYSQY